MGEDRAKCEVTPGERPSENGLERLRVGGIAADAIEKDDRQAASPISVGARIKMSLLGATRNPHFAEKEGTVVGWSRLNGSVRILFDGRKTPISLHRDYIEPRALKEG